MSHSKWVPKETLAAIEEAYLDEPGVSAAELARRFKLAPSTMPKLLRRLGLREGGTGRVAAGDQMPALDDGKLLSALIMADLQPADLGHRASLGRPVTIRQEIPL